MNTINEQYDFLLQHNVSDFKGLGCCDCCGAEVESGYVSDRDITFICKDCFELLEAIESGVSLAELVIENE